MIGAEGEHRIEDRRRRRCGLRCKMRRETKRASTSDFVVEGPHPPPTGNHCVGRGQKEKKAEKREKRRRGNWGGEWWGRVGGWVARGTAAPSTTPREESQQQRRETPPLPSGPGRPAGVTVGVEKPSRAVVCCRRRFTRPLAMPSPPGLVAVSRRS